MDILVLSVDDWEATYVDGVCEGQDHAHTFTEWLKRNTITANITRAVAAGADTYARAKLLGAKTVD